MKLFADLRRRAEARAGESYPIITIQEAGLDGFWLHRVLQQNGIESHVVDPASIATPRRRRRAKTDRLDGATTQSSPLALLWIAFISKQLCQTKRWCWRVRDIR
jgi:transposase